jgi:NAD(P)H-hydrate epimerase
VTDWVRIDKEFVAERIPPRSSDSHKGMNGRVCIVGGSRTYHGAPFLCAYGALRTGVDLVYLAVPEVIATAVRALSPDLIVVPLPDGRLTRGTVSRLKKWLPQVDALGIGPGLGHQNDEQIVNAVRELGAGLKGVVVDADALRPGLMREGITDRMIITPHAGEFERLFSAKLSSSSEVRIIQARNEAKQHHIVILLKGPTDIITDGERVATNSFHSPGMTVGGTGDVLTGITTSLVSKGLSLFDSCCCAAFINGSAGLEAANDFGFHITASDLANKIPRVMKQFDKLEK